MVWMDEELLFGARLNVNSARLQVSDCSSLQNVIVAAAAPNS